MENYYLDFFLIGVFIYILARFIPMSKCIAIEAKTSKSILHCDAHISQSD